MLACVTADHEPAGIVRREKDMTFSEEPFQLRNAYILEMTPKGNAKLRTVVYIDTEAFVWLGAEFFAGNEKTEAAFPFWRSSPSPSGGYVFELAGEFYVPFDQLTTRRFFAENQQWFVTRFFRSEPAWNSLVRLISREIFCHTCQMLDSQRRDFCGDLRRLIFVESS
jgi:hypothetical protein